MLNETFSSTAFGEALYLAQDLLCGFMVIGARVIFATHLIELVDHFEQMEGMVEAQEHLCSLVAGIQVDDDEIKPTYVITRRSPLGRSYAREIAQRHGISLAQILAARADKVNKS